MTTAIECHPRNGLSRTAALLAGGGPVTIGYFGGSITQADGWRNETFNWFVRQFAAVSFTMVPASVGGTGSDLGVYRMDRDLLPFKPDLLFVEFSVNDSETDESLIVGALEGIVRKCRRNIPACDIVFVYSMESTMTSDLRQGRYHPAALFHERVADHYAIPSIHLGVEVARREAEGSLVFTASGSAKIELERAGKLVFSSDGVHPLAPGHKLYADAVIRHLPTLLASDAVPSTVLPPPLSPGRWETAALIAPAQLVLSEDWRSLTRDQWPPIAWSAHCLPELYVADKPGASMDFAFNGTAFGLFLVVGPACGQIEWVLDDQPPALTELFDGFCTYYRPNYKILVHNLPEREHRIRIRLLAEEPDKKALLATRENTMDFPERFIGTRFYLAAGLVNGSSLSLNNR